MRHPNFQGFPFTEVHGDTISILLRWRTPTRLRYRDILWKVSVIVSILLGLFGFLWGGLSRYDPLLLAALFISWLLAVRVALNAMTWRSRVIEFTRESIRFAYKLEPKKSLQRALPHGFRIQPMMMLPQGQMGQQGQQLWPMMQSNFYLVLDHVEQSCLLAEVAGVKSAELMLRRLVAVSDWMRQRYDDQRIVEHDGGETPRGTFHKRRAS